MTYISESLRYRVLQRAEERCEYCHLHRRHGLFSHEIDHIHAEKHQGQTVESNLCLACADCNRFKGSDLCSLDPETGQVVALFHPRRDEWSEHFRLQEQGMIMPLTPSGRVTVFLLRMNALETIAERQALIALGEF